MKAFCQAVMSLALMALAASAAAWGPAPGSQLPEPFSAVNAAGEPVTLEDLVGEHGVTLALIRSLDWCPFCMRQARELDEHAQAFADTGFPVVTLSYDSPAQLKAFAEKHDISIPLLSDTDSRLIRALGILNDNYSPGERGYGIPDPGLMVVNSAGEVLATFAEPNYKNRPKPETVLERLRQLGQD